MTKLTSFAEAMLECERQHAEFRRRVDVTVEMFVSEYSAWPPPGPTFQAETWKALWADCAKEAASIPNEGNVGLLEALVLVMRSPEAGHSHIVAAHRGFFRELAELAQIETVRTHFNHVWELRRWQPLWLPASDPVRLSAAINALHELTSCIDAGFWEHARYSMERHLDCLCVRTVSL